MIGTGRVLLAVGGYGVLLLATGVAVLVGPDGVPARAVPGRAVAEAPVVVPAQPVLPGPVLPGPVLPGPVLPGPVLPRSGPVVEAGEGRDIAVRDVFRPTGLTVWSGRTASVVPASVRSDGSLVVPDDPAVVGWWTGGSQAGEAFGHVVVAGHIDSARLGVGILAELVTARRGQLVTLTAGEKKLTYRVVSTRQIKKADLAADRSIFALDAEPRLVLITCGGRFDPVAHRYEDNLIVEAVPV